MLNNLLAIPSGVQIAALNVDFLVIAGAGGGGGENVGGNQVGAGGGGADVRPVDAVGEALFDDGAAVGLVVTDGHVFAPPCWSNHPGDSRRRGGGEV